MSVPEVALAAIPHGGVRGEYGCRELRVPGGATRSRRTVRNCTVRRGNVRSCSNVRSCNVRSCNVSKAVAVVEDEAPGVQGKRLGRDVRERDHQGGSAGLLSSCPRTVSDALLFSDSRLVTMVVTCAGSELENIVHL